MPPLRPAIVLAAVCLAGQGASGMVIFCDGPDFRVITTERHRPAEFGYPQALAAAEAESSRRVREAGELIGQVSDVRRPEPTLAPGASPAAGPSPARQRPLRPMVERDRAAQAVRLCNRGLLQMQSGKIQDAVDAFEQAMKLNPGDSRALMLRGVAAARLGRHESALDYYNRALEIDPGSVEAYQSRGLAMMKLDRLPQAVADFTKAVTLNPKFEEGFVRRGLAYGRLGDFEKSVADNTAAIALNPKNPLSYNNRAAAYKALGQNDKAAADAEISRRLEAQIEGRK